MSPWDPFFIVKSFALRSLRVARPLFDLSQNSGQLEGVMPFCHRNLTTISLKSVEYPIQLFFLLLF
jgi:hypothetical protein